MKTTKRQTFCLDGVVYSYRITEAAIRNYEQSTQRQIANSLPLVQVVRALYHIACMLPGTYSEEELVKAYREGRLYTRKTRGEYTLRGIRTLLVVARREYVRTSLSILSSI